MRKWIKLKKKTRKAEPKSFIIINFSFRNGKVSRRSRNWHEKTLINQIIKEITPVGQELTKIINLKIEKNVEKLLRQQVYMDEVQFYFTPWYETNDAIFILG